MHTLMCGVSRSGSLLCTWPYRFTQPGGSTPIGTCLNTIGGSVSIARIPVATPCPAASSSPVLLLKSWFPTTRILRPGASRIRARPDSPRLPATSPPFSTVLSVPTTDFQAVIIVLSMSRSFANGLVHSLMMLACHRCRSDQTHVRCPSGTILISRLSRVAYEVRNEPVAFVSIVRRERSAPARATAPSLRHDTAAGVLDRAEAATTEARAFPRRRAGHRRPIDRWGVEQENVRKWAANDPARPDETPSAPRHPEGQLLDSC